MQLRSMLVGCLISSSVANSAMAAEARFSTRLVPAMQDVRCAPLQRSFYARCDPRGFVRLRGPDLVVAAGNLKGYEAYRVSFGGDLITPAAWLVVYVTVLPPPSSNCSCPAVGCCQTPPIATTLVAPVSSTDGEVQFRGRLPFKTNTRIEIRGVEIRAAGNCLGTTARELQTGNEIFAELGPALAVGGPGRLF